MLHHRPVRALLVASVALAACGTPAARGTPQPLHLPVAAAVDTMAPAPADAEVVARLVGSYLRLRPAGRAPNAHWRRDEQARFPRFDIAGMATYGSPWFRARYGPWRVVIEPPPFDAEPGVLEAVVHFQPRERVPEQPVSVRLFARREGGTWRLGGALPQLTRRWPETTLGAITFRTQPGIALDTARAAHAARWVDSLATEFGAPPPRDLLYVLTRGWDDAQYALGIVGRFPRFGGIHYGPNRLIISTAGARDRYLWHELAHAVFHQVGRHHLEHRLASEGAAEWMEWRMTPASAEAGRRQVGAILARQPKLGVLAVAERRDRDATAAFYPTGAWLVGAVYERGGVRGVRDLLLTRADAGEVLAVARRYTGLSRKGLDSAWRAWAQAPAPVATSTP